MGNLRIAIHAALRDITFVLHRLGAAPELSDEIKNRMSRLLSEVVTHEERVSQQAVNMPPSIMCQQIVESIADDVVGFVAPNKENDRLEKRAVEYRSEIAALEERIKELEIELAVVKGTSDRHDEAHQLMLQAFFRETLQLRKRNLAAEGDAAINKVNKEALFDYGKYVATWQAHGADLQLRYEMLEKEFADFKEHARLEKEKADGYFLEMNRSKNVEIDALMDRNAELEVLANQIRTAVDRDTMSIRRQFQPIREFMARAQSFIAGLAEQVATTTASMRDQTDLLVKYIEAACGFMVSEARGSNSDDFNRDVFQQVLAVNKADPQTLADAKLAWRKHPITGTVLSAVVAVRKSCRAQRDLEHKLKLLSALPHTAGDGVSFPGGMSPSSPSKHSGVGVGTNGSGSNKILFSEASSLAEDFQFLHRLFKAANDASFDMRPHERLLILDAAKVHKSLSHKRSNLIFRRVADRVMRGRLGKAMDTVDEEHTDSMRLSRRRTTIDLAMAASGIGSGDFEARKSSVEVEELGKSVLKLRTSRESLQSVVERLMDKEVWSKERCNSIRAEMVGNAIKMFQALDRTILVDVRGRIQRRRARGSRKGSAGGSSSPRTRSRSKVGGALTLSSQSAGSAGGGRDGGPSPLSWEALNSSGVDPMTQNPTVPGETGPGGGQLMVDGVNVVGFQPQGFVVPRQELKELIAVDDDDANLLRIKRLDHKKSYIIPTMGGVGTFDLQQRSIAVAAMTEHMESSMGALLEAVTVKPLESIEDQKLNTQSRRAESARASRVSSASNQRPGALQYALPNSSRVSSASTTRPTQPAPLPLPAPPLSPRTTPAASRQSSAQPSSRRPVALPRRPSNGTQQESSPSV